MKNENRKIDHEMGKFIWSIVDKSEYSQEKWAEILNVSTRTMGYYCSGERKPTQRKLLQLIKVAGGINAGAVSLRKPRRKRKSGCSLPKGIEHPLALLYN